MTSRKKVETNRSKWGVDTALIQPLLQRVAARKTLDLVALAAEFGVPLKIVKHVKEEIETTNLTVGADQLLSPLPNLYKLAASLDLGAAESQKKAVQSVIDSAPAPFVDLDQVAATPETVIRRALLIKSRYYFDGIRILCMGDHDLTSVALGLVMPRAMISVCDIDERIISHINNASHALKLSIDTHISDLRLSLPRELVARFDLVLTDPPYSPVGVELFCARSVQAITSDNPAAILLCYGASMTRRDLVWDVQARLIRLALATEALLPQFNEYRGAQTIGSRSDLYALRPTQDSILAANALQASSHIYTNGRYSTESRH